VEEVKKGAVAFTIGSVVAVSTLLPSCTIDVEIAGLASSLCLHKCHLNLS
jgi:hypothetical protein